MTAAVIRRQRRRQMFRKKEKTLLVTKISFVYNIQKLIHFKYYIYKLDIE